MEISDRNNVIQPVLNLSFESKNAVQSASLAFIDMLKAPQIQTSSDTSVNDVAPKYDNLKQSYKTSAKDYQIKDNADKPAHTKKVKETAIKPKNKPFSPAKDTDTEAVANATPQTVSQNVTETTDNNSVAPVTDSESSPVTENELNNELPASDLALDVAISEPDITTVMLPETTTVEIAKDEFLTQLSPQNTADNGLIEVHPQNTETSAEVILPQQNFATDAAEEKNTPSVSLSDKNILSEDELIVEQEQLLDKKIIHEKPLDITVNNQSAKIAEPLQQDILQNSFEITSFLQNADNNADNLPLVNFQDGEKTNSPESSTTIDTTADNVTQPQLEIAYTASAVDSVVSAHLDNDNILLTSQEIQSVNLSNRNEFSLKLQEVNTDASLKGLGKEAVEQIKINITKSAVKSVDSIDIELKPEELGKVQVRMYIHKDGRLHTDIIASRQETAELLQREIEGLSKAFQDAGYDTDKQSFNFRFQDENPADKQQDGQKLQQFIGETLEQEAEDNLANDNMIYDPRRGLNIRV